MKVNKDNYDIIAKVALQDLDKETRLRGIVTESGYAYYYRGGIPGFLAYILFLAWIVGMVAMEVIPAWGSMILVLTLFSLLESRRQRERLNALVKLMEIEKGKPQANKNLETMVHKLDGTQDYNHTSM